MSWSATTGREAPCPVVLRSYTFETERLLVQEWHSLSPSEWQQEDLAEVVAAILTEPVTRTLPFSWQGSYSVDRAREWIKRRDQEGTTLIVIDRSTHRAAGMVILFEMEAEEGAGGVDIRLGYVLSEATWGRGIASEIVNGFVSWCRGQKSISSIASGVAHDNPASRRVLEKNGFKLAQSEDDVAQSEQLYRLSFRRE